MKKARKKVAPAAKKRGADAHVPPKSKGHQLAKEEDKKLEQGLKESMAGSDPPSITQPAADQKKGPVQTTDRTQQNPSFEKPLGSSHKDEADLREVAKEARRKSK
jgi:hypothetical protein